MIKDFCSKNWQIILFNFVLLIIFAVFYGRFGDINVDCFREAYIPTQIINGGVLYKNIFTIYAPFSYLFNALIFLIFGISLNVLYFAGFLTTAAITNLFFLISKNFIEKNYALGIILFFIASAVLSNNVFNFIFPYSYGIIYGILFILLSIYFALKKNFFWAYFMYSFAICSKYEFVLLLPLLIWFSGKKDLWKNLLGLILPIIINFLPLFIQGLSISDFVLSAKLAAGITSSKTLYWFYSITGLVFRPQILLIYLISFIKILIPFVLIYYFKNWFVYCISLIYLYFAVNQEILVYILPLILIMSLFRIKKTDKEGLFFVFATLLISAKVFFALTLESYGIYYILPALLSLFILLPQKYHKTLFITLLLSAIPIMTFNIQKLENKNFKIETEKGVFYTYSKYGQPNSDLINYINNSTDKLDRVVIYPEGLFPNFVTGRSSDNKIYSLIPLYAELFGEEIVIKRLEITKPEYIITSNYDTSNYYYSSFGNDYAADVMKYITQNYSTEKSLGEDFKYTIYRKKN